VNSKNSMRRHKSLDENSLPIIANQVAEAEQKQIQRGG